MNRKSKNSQQLKKMIIEIAYIDVFRETIK